MKFLWFCFAGILAGVLGGMGMGGGTILIPLLNIFYDVGQHTAQGINLISFIPMAIVALIIHFKNKLIEFKHVLYIIVPGLVTCFIGCYVARIIEGEMLRRIFGGFLIALAIFQTILNFKMKKE